MILIGVDPDGIGLAVPCIWQVRGLRLRLFYPIAFLQAAPIAKGDRAAAART
jgi:hypothetical protein